VGSSASSPPHEPSDLLHDEGKAATEGIDGGSLKLGLRVWRWLGGCGYGANPREERGRRL
jgi:hypothetical protein